MIKCLIFLNYYSKTAAFLTLLSLVLILQPPPVHAALKLPTGFISEMVVSGITSPTTIAWSPDGRLFIAQKDGRVRVFKNGALLPTDFIDIAPQVNNYWDRGLLGIAIHPGFPNTPYVYLLFAYDPPGVVADGEGDRVSRLLRVSADPNNPDVALPGSEVVLLGNNSIRENIGDETTWKSAPASCDSGGIPIEDCIPIDGPSHSVGTVMFGKDGSLFVSHGDGSRFNGTDPQALRAQNLDSLAGKILRIHPLTGNGYSNNPFYNGNSATNRSKVYSYGLRNPFRIALHPTTNEPFIGDVGWNTWEEINTGRGKNFGWPCYEGDNTRSAVQPSYAQASSTKPQCEALYAQGLGAVEASIFAYSHSGQGASVQAGAFYQGTSYPVQYRNTLFIADYNRDWIKYLTFNANGKATSNDFASDVSPSGGPVQVIAGPDTNLYYVVFNGINNSEIRRIRYTSGANTTPTAKASATPTEGIWPLTVTFSSAGSSDPAGRTLSYRWEFGDGIAASEANPTHTYTSPGTYSAILTVTNTLGISSTDSITIKVNNSSVGNPNPPVATITTPVVGTTYNVGDTIAFSGRGNDVEDGALSPNRLSWEVLLHHNEHRHFDYFNATGSSGSFSAPDHGDGTWIELCLTVTDSGGLKDTRCVELRPNTVVYSFATQPSGLQLVYEGASRTTPFSVTTIVNAQQEIIAPQVQQNWTFRAWSDGGAATHTIIIGTSPRTYTATYLNNSVGLLPTPWLNTDIGDVGAKGSAAYSSANKGTFTVKGAGRDIWSTNDGFQYAFRPLNGDGTIVARVKSLTNTHAWAKAGIMIRENFAANSPHATIVMTPANGAAFQRRLVTNGKTYNTSALNLKAPHWLRLERKGTNFSAYRSADGKTWKLVGKVTINMNTSAYVGLAVSSHDYDDLTTSVMDNVSVTTP